MRLANFIILVKKNLILKKALPLLTASLLWLPSSSLVLATELLETSSSDSSEALADENTTDQNKENEDDDAIQDGTDEEPMDSNEPDPEPEPAVSAARAGEKSLYEWKLDQQDYRDRQKKALTQAEKDALQERIDEVDAIAHRYEGIPMYRLYNYSTGEHFYTGSESERTQLIEDGWKNEGIGWYAPTEGDPVYRLFNPEGDHHYTTSKEERDALVKYGWVYEGVGWKTLSKQDGVNATPVYRQYNGNEKICNHNYTTSVNEMKSLIQLGWKDEEIGWYGVAPYSKVVNANGSTYFYDYHTMEPLTGDQTICGVRYYLLPKSNGEMLKGLAFLNGEFILCSEDGERLSGWQEYDDHTYYFDRKTFVALTGIQKLTKEQDGKQARIVGFDQFGRLLKNTTVDGHEFDANGNLVNLDEEQEAWLEAHR